MKGIEFTATVGPGIVILSKHILIAYMISIGKNTDLIYFYYFVQSTRYRFVFQFNQLVFFLTILRDHFFCEILDISSSGH